jgi:N-acetylneuraminate synthase
MACNKIEEVPGCAKNHLVLYLHLYNCTSGYPVSYKDVYLLEVSTMREKYGNRVKHISFCGHHHGT